ncbi:MAG TPA: hypothetical protein VGO80_06935 [Solirubrobacteraceae bacterium]|nr:hypothetical protein [Solirubrobacteraceae bacterium]
MRNVAALTLSAATRARWLASGPHLERLADDERERFLDAVMVRLGERPLLQYVRLNIVARRR